MWGCWVMGKERFSELRRSMEGISQRMLTLTLEELQRDGLIARTAYPAIPPRVQYEQNWEIEPAKIAKEFRARRTNTTRRSPKMCKTFADPCAIAPVRGG
jgi:hypothetical protein